MKWFVLHGWFTLMQNKLLLFVGVAKNITSVCASQWIVQLTLAQNEPLPLRQIVNLILL
jgi:hypothetical protein